MSTPAQKGTTALVESDQQQRVIDRLAELYASDRIEIEEYERRVELVEQAGTLVEMRALVVDLDPDFALAGTSTALVPVADVPERRSLLAVFGSVSRGRSWTVPRSLKVTSVFGSAELDFREARLGPGTTEVQVKAVMGSVEITVPPGLQVEVDGTGIMGSFESPPELSDPAPDRAEGAPTLRIRGTAVMGSVEVDERLPGESRSDRRLRQRREKKQLREQQRKQLTDGQ